MKSCSSGGGGAAMAAAGAGRSGRCGAERASSPRRPLGPCGRARRLKEPPPPRPAPRMPHGRAGPRGAAAARPGPSRRLRLLVSAPHSSRPAHTPFPPPTRLPAQRRPEICSPGPAGAPFLAGRQTQRAHLAAPSAPTRFRPRRRYRELSLATWEIECFRCDM
ncbi:collagen alpha-1(I) chain-like [Bubalus bubalis]|uniref:collagen alpha-1(I) chain-like n=1 Tax=Bubalus bubalis TaxID=89462 RepID=UPI001D1049D6|nr:collagen alpha-1(I) chain-like [Bubalus bubalis]